jgi:hypothetical protein
MKEITVLEDLSRIIVICPNVFRLVESPEFRMCFESRGPVTAETSPQNNPAMGHELSLA